MKRAIMLGVLVAVLFAVFVWAEGLIGAESFFLGALALGLFAVLGPAGDWVKMAVAVLIGIILGLITILTLALAFPLPPDNSLYVAIVSAVAVFLVILLSTTGLRIDGMLMGWASYLATVYGTYTSDATQLATVAVPSALGVAVTLLAGMVLAVIILKIVMAQAKAR